MTQAQFDAMKLHKFRRLVRHVYRRSPYYRRVIEVHHIDIDRCVPADFPALSKTTVLENFDLLVTDRRVTQERITTFLARSRDPNELFLDRFRVVHTSGSSGEKGYVVFSQADWARGMSQFARGTASHAPPLRQRHLGRLRVAFYGAVAGHFAGVTIVSAAMQSADMRLCEVNEPLSRTIAQLNEFQPDLLAGYTGALTILAAKQREGVLNIAPVAVATLGEGMSVTERTTLEGAFNCPASNAYGSSEHLVMGAFVPEASTMQLYDDDLIYEIFEDHCLITNLFNFTLPLIRYRIDDVMRPVMPKTNPGSPYLEVESLVGRSEQMATFVNDDGTDDYISPHAIAALLVPGVERFQLQVTSSSSFRFLVCLAPSLKAEARVRAVAAVHAYLREMLVRKKMSKVTFEVSVVEDLPLNVRSRKFEIIANA